MKNKSEEGEMAIATQCLCISRNEMLEYENAKRHNDDKGKRWTREKSAIFMSLGVTTN